MTEPSTTPLEFQGCRFAFEVHGQGIPVVFIQGIGVHGRGWMPQVDELRTDHQCLIFDNRGMGASQPVGKSITVEQMAEDTLCLMSHVGWESANVVAHSLGGPVALAMALAHPHRVRSLSLLCTVARGADATRLTPQILWLGLRTRVGSLRSRRHAFLRMVMPESALATIDRDAMAASLEPLFGHDLAIQPPIAMKQLAALRAYDARRRLGELAGIPALVVSAEHDPIAAPEFGRALAQALPGARYNEFTDASHGLPIQYAGPVNDLLREHIKVAESKRDQ